MSHKKANTNGYATYEISIHIFYMKGNYKHINNFWDKKKNIDQVQLEGYCFLFYIYLVKGQNVK